MENETSKIRQSNIYIENTDRNGTRKTAARLLLDLRKLTTIPKEGTTYGLHGIHPYAAKFIPQVPARIIESCVNTRHRVLDPFCGSGTTLAEAYVRGIRSVGFDINPIAVLLSKVKTTFLEGEEWNQADRFAAEINTKLLNNDCSRAWYPEIPRADHWFKDHVLSDLGIIAGELKQIENEKIRNVLEVAFSSIVVSVSNQESETRFAAIEKELSSDIVRTQFSRKFSDISRKIKLTNTPSNDIVSCQVFLKDTRNMSQCIPSRSIDLVVTSPPYLNSYDYYLYHKFRIYWLGFDKNITNVENVKEMELGARYHYSGDKPKSIAIFRQNISDCFKEIGKVTKLGKLVFVLVGDSIVQGKFIEMDEFYEDICSELGLNLVAKTSYSLRDITRSFVSQNVAKGNMYDKKQHILVFQNLHRMGKSENESPENYEADASTNNSKDEIVVKEIPKHVANGSLLRIDNNAISKFTHGFIKYPSKFIPDIPRWAIINYSQLGDCVLDPFVGCGTTMVESRLLGRNCIGLDVNPFAVLASNVKSNSIPENLLIGELNRILTRFSKIDQPKIPDFPLRDFWFDSKVLRRFSQLKSAINEQENSQLREFYLLTLGSIVKQCSYWDESQIKIERDQKKLVNGVQDPETLFRKKAISNISGMSKFANAVDPLNYSKAFLCDTSKVPETLQKDGKTYQLNNFDIIVTSPPYINAINYSMFTRFELYLLDLVAPESYLLHQRDYLGTERVYAREYHQSAAFSVGNKSFCDLNRKIDKIDELEPKRAYITRKYFDGMVKSLLAIHRMLKPKGKFVFVAGSNTIKGVEIPTFDILRECAEEIGFSTLNVFSYQIQKHRFKITRHATGKKIKIDNIVVTEKK